MGRSYKALYGSTARASGSQISLLVLIVVVGICSTWNVADAKNTRVAKGDKGDKGAKGAKGEGAFHRPCDEHGSCTFKAGVEPHKKGDSIGLTCSKEKTCECAMVQMADAAFWNLSWNAKKKTCLIPEKGACGVDRGLEIGCISGLECIENRCRDRKKLGQSGEGISCDGDIDCVKGLVCKLPEDADPFTSTSCTKP